MKWKRRPHLLAVLVLVGTISIWGASSWGDRGLAEQPRENPVRKADTSPPMVKPVESIAETKKKGFEGVDFSYDVFGAPPGQDPVKIAEQVKAKDLAEKPKVLAKQKQLLTDRYALDCRTQSTVTMTKGKPQPLGPTTQLKSGLTWEKLSGFDAEEIKSKKLSDYDHNTDNRDDLHGSNWSSWARGFSSLRPPISSDGAATMGS